MAGIRSWKIEWNGEMDRKGVDAKKKWKEKESTPKEDVV